MENNNFNNNPMKPEENIEKVETNSETPITPEVSAPTQENIVEPKVEVNINQPEVKVTIEQPKPEGKMQKFKSTFKDKLGKVKSFAIKRKPLVIAASVLLVAGITTGITVGAIAASGGLVAPVKDKFDKMKKYYYDYLIKTTNIDNYKDISAKQLLKRGAYWKTIKVEGEDTKIYTKLIKKQISGVTAYFLEDIDYNDGFNRDSWPAATHVGEAQKIAIAATVKHDPEMMNIAVGMTYYWVFNNFRCTNWWHNDLGAGGSGLANLGIFTYDHLNSRGKGLLVSKVANASFYYRPSLLTHAGTNLFDYADITLRSSIFTKNEDEFNLVIQRIEEEITDRHLEGFQTDGSFFQHGQQVQIASYGKGVIRLAKVLKAISVTGYSIGEDKLQIISRYILRGLRDMTHKGYINYSAVSREYVRTNNLKTSNNNFSQFSELLDLPDFPGKDRLKTYLDNLEQGKSTFNGVEYFDRAKMIAANLDDLYISFKGTDSYLTNTECVNEENRLGINLSYGTNTCVMDQGDEYFNIAPIWNYAYIPGTTSINVTQNEDFNQPNENDTKLLTMAKDNYYKDELFEKRLPEAIDDEEKNILYGGGVYPSDNADNDIGETICWSTQNSIHHDENTFAVTCLSTKYGTILLGANLSYSGSVTDSLLDFTPNLHTTIEQCHLLDEKEYKLEEGNKKLTYGNAVYKILDDHTIKVQSNNISIKGAWGRNRNPTDEEKTQVVKGKTLLAYIDHGPTKTGSDVNKYKYAYVIQPKSLANDPDYSFQIVQNFSTDATINPGYTVQEVVIENKKEHKKIDIVIPFHVIDGAGGYLPSICTSEEDRVTIGRGEIYATDTFDY